MKSAVLAAAAALSCAGEHFDGASLSDEGVHVLDPFAGTGTFIARMLQSGLIRPEDVERKYRAEIHANEIMLLAYYIAALNIEHAYYEITQTYDPFEGLCFVDTLDIAEKKQKGFAFINEENTQRVERQKRTPITVIIGNPPYNMGQKSENENNKNRAYDET